MRAVCYARVSGAAQRERDTIASQMRTLPAFVAARGWELVRPVDTYVDNGRTAKAGHLEARTGLSRLLRDAAARAFDVVVIVDFDRLTRAEDLTERGMILGALQHAGVRVADAMSGEVMDLGTDHGDLIASLKAYLAAAENRKRSERVRQGKVSAAQRGAKVGRGPYGLAYDRASRSWSVDPRRGPVVIEAYERVAAGESCTSIAVDLEARGVPAPGAAWTKGRVRDLIRSRHPVGEWMAHHATRTAVAVPPIVGADLWQAAQESLTKLRTQGLRRTRHVYLLEALAVCGACGAPMRIRSANVKRGRWLRPAVYRCERNPGGRCAAPTVRTADADARAWAAICGILDDRDLPAEIAAVRRERAADTQDWERDAAGFRAHLARLDKVAEALLVRFRRGVISEAELDRELAAANRERTAVRAQLAAAERVRGSIAGARERMLEATAIVEQLRERMAVASPQERRAIAVTLIDPGGVTFAGQALRIEMFVERPEGAFVDAASCSSVHENRLRIRVVA
jgi:site-specific DNA recombinase